MARLTKSHDNLQDLMHQNDLMLEQITLQLADINQTIQETNKILKEVLK